VLLGLREQLIRDFERILDEYNSYHLPAYMNELSLALSTLIRGTDFIFEELPLTRIVDTVFALYNVDHLFVADIADHTERYLSLLFLLGMYY
jgi:hypothetical protein